MTDAQYAWLVGVLGPNAMDRATADAMYVELGSVKAVALTYAGAQMAEIHQANTRGFDGRHRVRRKPSP